MANADNMETRGAAIAHKNSGLYKQFPLLLNVWIHDILPFLGDPRYIWGVFTSSRSSIHAALGLLGTLRVESIDRIWWKLTKLQPLFTCESDTSSVEELEPKTKTKQKRPPAKKSVLPRHRKEKSSAPQLDPPVDAQIDQNWGHRTTWENLHNDTHEVAAAEKKWKRRRKRLDWEEKPVKVPLRAPRPIPSPLASLWIYGSQYQKCALS